jgi:Rrf2 family nitric oxide-sensitive transcriptional repressor
MQLTRFTDLGLRVLMYLSHEGRTRPVTISEIAQQLDVPRNHLVKVVTFLNKAGWVQTTRGPRGGMRLGTDPASLRLGSMIRTLEGKDSLIDCREPPCPLAGMCGLKEALDQGLSSFYRDLDQFSLADVVKPRTAEVIVRLHQRYLQLA